MKNENMEINTMKKIILVIAILSIFALSGCGNQSPTQPQSPAPQPVTTATLTVINAYYTTPIEIRWQNIPVMNVPATWSTQTTQIQPNTGNFYVFRNGINIAISRTITVLPGQTITLTVGQGTMR